MKLTIVGCSGSYAGPHSPASCYLLQADLDGRTWSVLLDLGNGALGELQRHLAPRDVDAVVLSHLHPDHCADLSGLHVMLRYDPAGAPEVALPIYGPSGTDLRAARASGVSDDEAGDAHLLRPEMDFRDLADAQTFTIGPFRITPLRVNHPVEAYGLRVEADGRTLAYTGDTDTCAALSPLMTEADLVLSDSAFCEDRDDVEGIHLSGHRAATAAVLAGGVKRLMLTHIPPWNDPEVCRAEADLVWPGDVELAQPGATYVL